ncbi:MAG: addiction module protein [bacterium]
MTISELEKSLLALSVNERARLALALLHSLESQDPDTYENWESVISERAAAYRNGDSKTEAADHVLARLRERERNFASRRVG